MDIQALLAALEHANYLKRLPRMGWLFAGVSNPESVAEHTCVGALLTLFLSDVINASWQKQGLTRPLDQEKLLKMALLHDFGESVLTDLPKRSADLLGRETKRQAEATALAHLVAKLPAADHYVEILDDYNADSSPEAYLLKDVDRLEMVHQALCYERGGVTTLDEFWQQSEWYYPVSRQLFTELCARRPRDTEIYRCSDNQ
ncbi:HD domain-containing protein [Chloroflexi bacterium TSY]|nr:HD domain-containing protein [Chloroflexi bacterium TSY]